MKTSLKKPPVVTSLELARRHVQLTQAELSSSLGIVQSTYAGYELGARPVPASIAYRLAEMLECDINDLFVPEKFSVKKL